MKNIAVEHVPRDGTCRHLLRRVAGLFDFDKEAGGDLRAPLRYLDSGVVFIDPRQSAYLQFLCPAEAAQQSMLQAGDLRCDLAKSREDLSDSRPQNGIIISSAFRAPAAVLV